jgi:Protein of unknown function (DUF4232)
MTQIPPTPGPGNDPDGLTPEEKAQKAASRRKVAVIILAIVAGILLILIIWLLVARANSTTVPTASPTPSPTATPTPTATSTPTSTATAGVKGCALAALKVTLGTPDGTAGTSYMPIIFTNIGTVSCELHGYPGVSFVGDGNGTQIGAAAVEDTSVAIVQNTLTPGAAVTARLAISDPGNYSDCSPVPVDGLRIYPPHSYGAAYVATTGLTGCSNASRKILTVQPVLPAG